MPYIIILYHLRTYNLKNINNACVNHLTKSDYCFKYIRNVNNIKNLSSKLPILLKILFQKNKILLKIYNGVMVFHEKLTK